MKIFISTIVVLVAMIAAFGIWWHEMNIVPVVTLPKPPPIPSPNAYDYFVAAYSLDRDSNKWIYAAITTKPGYKGLISDPHDKYYDPDDRYYSLPEQEALLKENLAMIAKVRQGLAYGFYPIDAKPPIFFENKNSRFREEARLFGFASKVHSEEENWNEALRDELDCVELGERVEQNGGIMQLLTGIAIQAIGRKRVWDTIDHLSGDNARTGALRLENVINSQPHLADVLQTEKWHNEYELSNEFHMRAGAGTVLGIYENDFDKHPSRKDAMKLFATSKRSVMNRYDSYMDACTNRVSLSYQALNQHSVPLPADLLSREMVSYLDSFIFRDGVNDAENDLLMTSLALQSYKADHGSYPASLSQLVPRYLRAVPADPFAATGPLRYRKSAAKYVLYSLGPDGVDDGGRPILDPSKNVRLRYFVNEDSKGDMVAGVNFN